MTEPSGTGRPTDPGQPPAQEHEEPQPRAQHPGQPPAQEHDERQSTAQQAGQPPAQEHDEPQPTAQHDGPEPADQGEEPVDRLAERNGVPVLVVSADGPPVGTTQDALDLIGASYGRSEVVALPAERLDERFFTLGTGVAGEIMQKFVNYRIRLAIVGDISAHLAASSALRALVLESNRGRQIWFVADLDELDTHLA
jgi:hypothetical protein